MKEIKRKWWLLSIRGGVLALLALFIFGFDDFELVFTYWGITMLLLGIITFYLAIQWKRQERNWIFPLLLAIVDLALGFFVLLYTEQVVQFFRILVGGWAVGIGFVLIYMALRSEKQKWLLQINGMISVALGIVIILNPFAEDSRIDGFLLGVYSLLLGAYLTLLSFKIRPGKAERLELEIEESKNDDYTDDFSDEDKKREEDY
ncbi:MAG: hypothetical protein JJU02_05105 [Cryomorphaceae bacterium]|nr:hypothetical protein [Cryomorphaceae bacterium]